MQFFFILGVYAILQYFHIFLYALIVSQIYSVYEPDKNNYNLQFLDTSVCIKTLHLHMSTLCKRRYINTTIYTVQYSDGL